MEIRAAKPKKPTLRMLELTGESVSLLWHCACWRIIPVEQVPIRISLTLNKAEKYGVKPQDVIGYIRQGMPHDENLITYLEHDGEADLELPEAPYGSRNDPHCPYCMRPYFDPAIPADRDAFRKQIQQIRAKEEEFKQRFFPQTDEPEPTPTPAGHSEEDDDDADDLVSQQLQGSLPLVEPDWRGKTTEFPKSVAPKEMPAEEGGRTKGLKFSPEMSEKTRQKLLRDLTEKAKAGQISRERALQMYHELTASFNLQHWLQVKAAAGS